MQIKISRIDYVPINVININLIYLLCIYVLYLCQFCWSVLNTDNSCLDTVWLEHISMATL